MVTKNPPLHIYTSTLSRRQRAWVRSRRRKALGRRYIVRLVVGLAAFGLLLAAVVLATS